MKKICFYVFMLISTCSLLAQDVLYGAKAGLNIANLKGDVPDNSESRYAFFAGISAEILFTRDFTLQPELQFSGQGTKINDNERKLNYLNIPVMAKYYINHHISIEVGPQVGFLLSAKTGNETNIKNQYKDIDFGVNFGLGYRFDNGFNFGARYNLGLLNIIDANNDVSVQNEVIQIYLGFFWDKDRRR